MPASVHSLLHQAYINLLMKLPNTRDITTRLDRAYDIILAQGSGYGILRPSKCGEPYTVQRASTSLFEDNTATYSVTPTSCTCPDAAETSRTGICKHRLAIQLLEEMQRLHAQGV